MTRALREVADDPRAGRKAQTLARLLAAGLPVLDGLVVFAEDDEHALGRALAALGPGPYAVRSSSAREDVEGASAAGLYLSVIGVAAAEVPAAIARVRASADAPEVVAYLAARGARPTPIAVLVQAEVDATTLGVARSTDDGWLVESRRRDEPEWGDASAALLRRGDPDTLAALLDRVEHLLGGGIDVEWARGERVVVLQARAAPRAAATERARLPPGRWRLDAEHNPDPISAAQAGLVEIVDGARFGARARVIGSYLYVRQDAPTVIAERGDDALARFEAIDGPALRAELAAVEGAPLDAVIAVYVRVLRRYAAEVRPSLGGARRALDDVLRAELGESLDERPRLLAGVGGASQARDAALHALGRAPSAAREAEYLARYGMYAPAWDVRVACDDEDLARLRALADARARGPSPEALAAASRALATDAAEAIRRRLAAPARPRFDHALARLRGLLALADGDDVLFFAGQRVVRRALLARARVLVDAGALDALDDVFELPLSAVQEGERALAALAEAGRAARLRAARTVPPFRIVDGAAQVRLPASAEVLRGRGIGGVGRGPAYVVTSLLAPLDDVPAGAVLVVPTALPSLAPHLPRLAGLVTEHGGALSHAATLAGEIGLPAVVGVAGALQLRAGDSLYVDGERGRVLVLRPPTRR